MRTLLALTALVVAAAAAGYSLGRGSEHAVSLGPPPRQTTTAQATQVTGPLRSSRSFEVWFSRGGRLVQALRVYRPTPRVATAALAALLTGPTRAERAAGTGTEIPQGTRLLGLSIANGVAGVDLTSDFEAGAGSRSLKLRLAQVVYTLTQFPSVDAVRFSLDGTPVNVVSGSGVVLDHPVGRDAYRNLGPTITPLAGSWRRLPPAPVGPLTSRAGFWTGRELLVIGEAGGGVVLLAYVPRTDSWHRLRVPPGVRGSFRVAWTGKELVGWGTRAWAFNPSTRRWRRLPQPPVSGPPETLVWTGHELVGWTTSGGAAYRPAGNTWRTLPAAPLRGAAAWTGRELIVVSGSRAAAFTSHGGWRQLPSLPEPRVGASAVWDGRELLVIGGSSAPAVGFAYDPSRDTWRRLAQMESGRTGSAIVWVGTRLLLWGGATGRPGAFVIPLHGLAYDPRTDRWSPLPPAPLRGRVDPLGVWTGRSFVVWGGDPDFADGAAFTPSSHLGP